MRITISSSSKDEIDEQYKNESRKLITYLAEQDCELNWGSGINSIMGICYDEFSKNNKTIYGYTTSKYIDMIDDLPNAIHTVYDNTFDLRKSMFNDADLIICLPGGTGTVAEFLAFVEEMRSNDIKKTLILYNINNHFDSLLTLIDDLVKRNFNTKNIYDYFKVVNNLDDFKKIYSEITN